MTAVSSSASASWAALTVTVCAVDQFSAVNVSAPDTVTSASPELRDGVTVTFPLGCEVSTTV